ncbi:MAG: prepilin peptidase [Acidaminococcaceae bacterium]|nr:prepilin peptidase [Acidaminococcaceae bacterium]
MYLLFVAYFVIGLVVGSFLNVCIYRLPAGKSIVSPPSSCGSCGHRLGVFDMIPLLSYIFLRGKCRYCGMPYSPRYALVELLTGCLFALCGLYYLPGIPLALVFVFVASLVVLTFVDFDHQIILDEVLLLMLGCGAAYVFFTTGDYWDALYGMGFAGGLMLLIFVLSRGGMGAGDVKLCFVLGLWLGLKASVVCLMLAFVTGGVIGVLLLATGIKKRRDPIPFGPFLCIGAYISLLFSPYIIYYYWSLFI